MTLRAFTFFTLVLAALGLGPGVTHLLEMPVKLGYATRQYFEITSTLYAYFGAVGGAVQVATLACAAALAYMLRARPWLRWFVGAAVLFAASIVAWAGLVAPVNAAWAESIRSHSEAAPTLYAQLRARWEYGHMVALALWLAGYATLLWASLGQSGENHARGLAPRVGSTGKRSRKRSKSLQRMDVERRGGAVLGRDRDRARVHLRPLSCTEASGAAHRGTTTASARGSPSRRRRCAAQPDR